MLPVFVFLPFQCIYKLKKVCQPEEEAGRPRLSPEEVVDRIFQLVDENGDGEKFALWVTQNKYIYYAFSRQMFNGYTRTQKKDHLMHFNTHGQPVNSFLTQWISLFTHLYFPPNY